ncbi:MAG: SUMF1/EgtB/PvdO family nonheme iron enzyme, partial [bacterium]|nr:SUMF1/EgtB/PvdO family nonheme iron enzyme [bacterium]
LAELTTAPAPQRQWEQWRDELESHGFTDDTRDVVHFAAEEAQLELWYQLAALSAEPDQTEIDVYLGRLAPAGTIYIPAGAFLMGSGADDPDASDNEKPQHEVFVAGCYLGQYPVTNEAYARFIEAGGYGDESYWTEAGWQRKERDNWQQPRFWDNSDFNGPRQPVVGVSWYEAAAYCNWAGGRL